MENINEFDPVLYSNEENQFLLENVGKPTVVALKNVGPNVVLPAVKAVLDRVNELIELEKHEGLKWVGVQAIKDSITVWFRENSKWASEHRRFPRQAPRFPSLYSWDAKGRPHLGGPGSDSSRVKTFFGPAGERIPFAVKLIIEDGGAYKGPGFTEGSLDPSLKVDTDLHRIECRVPVEGGIMCGHTESYKADSRASYAAARARMSKHLRKATLNTEGHRELYTNEFGG